MRAFQITHAFSAGDIEGARELFREYAEALEIDFSYQGFEAEPSVLPGAYSPPRGCLLLAAVDQEAMGCVALRPLSDGACEMKRLYVRPSARQRGTGRELTKEVIAYARAAGYSRMLLDTLPSMHGAIRLYESLGFQRRDAYYDTPLTDTVFMELQL